MTGPQWQHWLSMSGSLLPPTVALLQGSVDAALCVWESEVQSVLGASGREIVKEGPLCYASLVSYNVSIILNYNFFPSFEIFILRHSRFILK